MCHLAAVAAGSGLSYQGQPLVATGPFAPLLLANTTTTPPGPTDDNLSFPPAGVPVSVCGSAHGLLGIEVALPAGAMSDCV